MAKFAKPSKQAASVIKKIQGSAIRSVGTARNYEASLTKVAQYLKEHRLGSLREITPKRAVEYLRVRGAVVGQKTLDMERQALQSMMLHVTGVLPQGGRLEVVKSTANSRDPKLGIESSGRGLAERSRIYSPEQVELIASRQAGHNALATRIAHASGIRAHELLTLQRLHRQAPDVRPVHEKKFSGIRENSIAYTVHGKGGLTREVRIPLDLARLLESRRLAEPRRVTDRGVRYLQCYDLGGGQPWSKSFSAASKSALGWSRGAHGLRHSYAQERVAVLQRQMLLDDAKLVVSQELGHFRPDITEVYLR